MSIFKILGLLSLLISLSLFGFYKSGCLRKRNRALSEITVSLGKLSQLVKNGTGELNRLFSLSFDRNVLLIKNEEPTLVCDELLKEDTELFRRLLNEMGISNRENEYKLIMLYKTLFEKQQKIAEENEKKLSKLYNSCGFLTGLSLCIFLI